MRRSAVLKAFAFLASFAALGAAAADAPRDETNSSSVTAIFGELLYLSYPREFHGAFQNTKGSFYIQESVLAHETVEHWTQMLTVTGTQGLALNREVTPARFIERLASGYRRHCPESFSETPLAAGPIAGVDSYGAILACGTVADPDGAHSEVALTVAFHGTRDYYTVQWAERGAPSAAPLNPPATQWLARLKRLTPIRLCPKLEGEGPPYVSCINSVSAPAAAATPDPNRQKG
jgi:hypothetical protein